MSNFLKVHTFRPGMCSLPICWHLHSEFGLVWTRDHGPTNWRLLRVFPQLKIARYCTPGGAFELPHKSGIYLLQAIHYNEELFTGNDYVSSSQLCYFTEDKHTTLIYAAVDNLQRVIAKLHVMILHIKDRNTLIVHSFVILK